MEEEEIQGNFIFLDPTPEDATGIVAYIPRELECDHFELAKIIAQQSIVGTLIKDPPDEEGPDHDQSLFGVTSCLNLGYYQDVPCVNALLHWFLSLDNPDLNELLSTKLNSVGLFIAERAYGVPDIMAPHVMRGILKEIEWATEDAKTEDMRKAFQLSYLLMVKKAVKTVDGLGFRQIEDELFYERAALRVEFESAKDNGDFTDCEYHRYILVVTMEAAQEVRAALNEMFDIDEAQYEAENSKE